MAVTFHECRQIELDSLHFQVWVEGKASFGHYDITWLKVLLSSAVPHYSKARPPKMQETYIKKPFGAVTVKNFTVLLADTLVLACSGQCAISESRKCCGWLKIFLAGNLRQQCSRCHECWFGLPVHTDHRVA